MTDRGDIGADLGPSPSALRSYLATLIEIARWKVLSTIALMVLFSLTEGVGVMLLLPTLQAGGLSLENQGQAGRYVRMISAAFAAVGLRPALSLLLGLFVVLVAARTLIGRAESVAIYQLEQTIEAQLRHRLYRAIANASWAFVCRRRASDFTHALTAELDRAGLAAYFLMSLLADLVIAAVYIAFAFALAPAMALPVLVSGVVLALMLRGRTRAVEVSGREISASTNSLYAAVVEHLANLKLAKAYGAEERNLSIFSDLSGEVARANVGAEREQAAATFWFQLGSALILGAVIYLSIRWLAVPPAEILILLLLFARVMPRFLSGDQHYRSLVGALPSFANAIALERQCVLAAERPAARDETVTMRRELRLEGVEFAYQSGAAPTLRGIDLVIPAGRIVALVGPSGAGKSTIADLAMGLLAPDSGRVTIDGVALDQPRTRRWREQIGYVAADTFLFHATVRENLRWARADATEDEMREAVRLASADEFVRALPHGLDTVVGDRGVLISQGERQRLALARANLRHPSLLVLDEATNNLDSENEARVLGALGDPRRGLTVLLIAHRLSTIRWANLIYVVEGGAIVESGDWESLSRKPDGRFRALRDAQSLEA